MTDAYQLVIDGKLTDAESGESFDSVDPSTGEPFAAVAKGGQEDARAALEAARRASDLSKDLAMLRVDTGGA